MTHIAPLSGPRVPPAAGGAPKQLVVLLHGLGADGEDLIDIARRIGHLLPQAEFVAPNAPEPCDMAPWGFQWFSLRDRRLAAMEEGARRAAGTLDAYLDGLLAERGLAPDRLALVGFSQGTMMALQIALRRPVPPAAVVGYSGALLDTGTLAAEVRSRPPVLLVHGEEDDVVPFEAMDRAAQTLQRVEVPVETMARPGLGHGIDPEGIAAGVAFLKRYLDG